MHLPPLPRSTSSASGSDRGPSTSGNFSGGSVSSHGVRGSAGRGGGTDSGDRADRDHMRRMIAGRGSGATSGGSAGGSASGGTGLSGTDSAGDSAGEYRMQLSGSGMSTSSSELVTYRITHQEDEDGFHVLTGREGKLTKCEDEASIMLTV